MYTKKTHMTHHIKNHATIYIFMIILFLTGVIFGAVIVNSMSFVQKQDLFFYLERFFGELVDEQQIESHDILKNSFFYHIKYLLLLFVLGLSVIGLPLVWVLLFLKGLVIGFSVGFIVNQLGLKGLLLAATAIAPQNLLLIPIYMIAGSLSMIFSLSLLSKLFSRKMLQPVVQPLGKYAASFTILLGASFFAAMIEAYISGGAMKMLVESFYG